MPRSTLALAAIASLALVAACSSGENAATSDSATAAAAPPPPPAAPADSAAAGATAAGAMLDPNTATKEQLTAVPGLDAALADSLIAKRPYDNMLAVDRILAKRLDETQRDTVYTRLFRPLDLNKTSGDEIMLIPGVGAKMRHEFEEYRPYKDIAQFRREMWDPLESTCRHASLSIL